MSRFQCASAAGLALALLACQDPSLPTNAPIEVGTARQATPAACKGPPPDHQILLPIAPRAQRIDLATPSFSNPTNVTNPLFPIAHLEHVVLTGLVDGSPFRAETTLLPTTHLIDLGAVQVRTLVSQYVAYLDGRIHETAIDWYAQADDGSVWYFGEDVSNYEDGTVANKRGTWLACKDGPVAMIMPAHPKVGDVFRVENIYPFVFEEVEITQTNLTLPGPLGPVAGSIRVRQLHLDSTYAPKEFAPGYGEFSTGSGSDIEALAVALPANATTAPPPKPLLGLLDDAAHTFERAERNEWRSAGRLVARIRGSWARLSQSGEVPARLVPLLAHGVDQLARAVNQRTADQARQAAIEIERAGLDVLVRFRPRVVVDHRRIAMFARQLRLDAQSEDVPAVTGDLAVIDIILDRLDGIAGQERVVAKLRSLVSKARKGTPRGRSHRLVQIAAQIVEVVDDD